MISALSRRIHVAVPVVLTLALVTSCGSSSQVEDITVASAADSSAAPDADAYHPDLIKFLEQFNVGNASWHPLPKSLEEAAGYSTVIVLASVAGVHPGKTLVHRPSLEPPKDDRSAPAGGGSDEKTAEEPPASSIRRKEVRFMDVELKVEKVLSGELQPGLDRVLVEFGANGSKDDPSGAKRLQAMLPTGQSIWFLQWMATRPFPRFPGLSEPSAENRLHYQITDHSSVFAQGESGVVAPMAPVKPEAMKAEATRSRKLSELVDRAKGLKTNGEVD